MIAVVLNIYEESPAYPDDVLTTQRLLWLTDDALLDGMSSDWDKGFLRQVRDLYWDIDEAVGMGQTESPLYDPEWEDIGWEGRVDRCLDKIAREKYANVVVRIEKPRLLGLHVG